MYSKRVIQNFILSQFWVTTALLKILKTEWEGTWHTRIIQLGHTAFHVKAWDRTPFDSH